MMLHVKSHVKRLTKKVKMNYLVIVLSKNKQSLSTFSFSHHD